MAFGTSHVALKERAQLQPGQTVLVLGAAGGVGIAAVQARAAAEAHARALRSGGREGWDGHTDELGAAAADCQGSFFWATAAQCRCGEAARDGCRALQIRQEYERPRRPAAASAPGRAGQRWATASPALRIGQRQTAYVRRRQIAKVMGARVVAVCRGAAKADALRALGADAVVDTADAGKDVPLRQLIKARAAPGPWPCGSRTLRPEVALHGIVCTVRCYDWFQVLYPA